MAKKDNLMVIGGAGFIGSSFVRLALDAGYRVIIVDKLTYAGSLLNLDNILELGVCDLQRAGLCDGPTILELLRKYDTDAVVNFALRSHVDRLISSPSGFVQTKVVGVTTLLMSAQQHWETLAA
jgi:dTDP-glucose 4,6-dehydratase